MHISLFKIRIMRLAKANESKSIHALKESFPFSSHASRFMSDPIIRNGSRAFHFPNKMYSHHILLSRISPQAFFSHYHGIYNNPFKEIKSYRIPHPLAQPSSLLKRYETS
jgi:hypothetical protein